MLTGGEAAAHCLQAVEVRGDGEAGGAGLLALALISFCNFVNSRFSAANSRAVGGGADAVAAAATGGEGGGGGGGKSEERGRSESESSICSRYFLAFA